jgi:hypothetical protein
MIQHSKKVNNDSNLNMEGVVVYSCLVDHKTNDLVPFSVS